MFTSRHSGIDAKKGNLLGIAILFLLGLLAAIAMHWVLTFGPGVGPDSTIYIAAARNLLSGNGYTVNGGIVTHFPPIYSLCLSLLSSFTGGDVVQSARLLNVFLLGTNVVLFGLAVLICTNRNWFAAMFAVVIFLTIGQAPWMHFWALSEPLFITFTLLTYIFVSLYFISRKSAYLFLTVVCAAFAMLTRYAGLALVPALFFALNFKDDEASSLKTKKIFGVCMAASIPVGLWLLLCFITNQRIGNRSFLLHPISYSKLSDLISSIYEYFFPWNISFVSKLGVVLSLTFFIIGLTVLLARQRPKEKKLKQSLSTFWIWVPFPISYLAFLIISISFFDAYTPLDWRLLWPFILFALIAGISALRLLSAVYAKNWIWICSIFFICIILGINLNRTLVKVTSVYPDGIGLTSRKWKHSVVLPYLEKIVPMPKIYTNAPDALLFHLNRQTTMLPRKTYLLIAQPNDQFELELSKVVEECKSGKALIVYFENYEWRQYLPTEGELRAQNELPILKDFSDEGIIFGKVTTSSRLED